MSISGAWVYQLLSPSEGIVRPGNTAQGTLCIGDIVDMPDALQATTTTRDHRSARGAWDRSSLHPRINDPRN